MDKDYTWVAPAELKKRFGQKYHIEGVPNVLNKKEKNLSIIEQILFFLCWT